MGRSLSKMIRVLRECGAFMEILPEVDAIFGASDISDGQGEVDLGRHLLKSLDLAAERDAPLNVRFALLVMNVGKSDSPREHLPVHYKHVERGGPRIEAICERFGAPTGCRDLAMLALSECERVHRVSKVRAGPVAEMLERLGAFSHLARFHQLMTLCACDFDAPASRSGKPYEKAALLEIALHACSKLDKTVSVDTLSLVRAEAVAKAFCSQRWSRELS